jgi:hypothetical protein
MNITGDHQTERHQRWGGVMGLSRRQRPRQHEPVVPATPIRRPCASPAPRRVAPQRHAPALEHHCARRAEGQVGSSPTLSSVWPYPPRDAPDSAGSSAAICPPDPCRCAA